MVKISSGETSYNIQVKPHNLQTCVNCGKSYILVHVNLEKNTAWSNKISHCPNCGNEMYGIINKDE